MPMCPLVPILYIIFIFFIYFFIDDVEIEGKFYTGTKNLMSSMVCVKNVLFLFTVCLFCRGVCQVSNILGGQIHPSPIFRKPFPYFFVIKPTRYTNFTNLFCHETLHV